MTKNSPAQKKGGKILICEDDESITQVMKLMLEQENYSVCVINSPAEIFEKIKNFLPDLILLDIWLPQMDGREIAGRLKSNYSTKKIPIVAISALNNLDNLSKEMGAKAFLSKPFTMESLLKIVEQNVKKPRYVASGVKK